MNLLCAALLLFSSFLFSESSSPLTFNKTIIDQAHFFTQSELLSLDTKVRSINKNQGAQVAVVTLPNLEGSTIEQKSIEIIDEWKLGDEEHDNGLLILIAKQERKMRIEVGHGLEGLITDYQSHQIIEEVMTPEFKKSRFFHGVDKTLTLIQQLLEGSVEAKEFLIKKKDNGNPYVAALVPIIFLLLILFSKLKKNGFSIVVFIFIFIMVFNVTHNYIISGVAGFIFSVLEKFGPKGGDGGGTGGFGRRGGSGWSGRSGGFGGSSGGGWSGGGGSFGGGGASGGW